MSRKDRPEHHDKIVFVRNPSGAFPQGTPRYQDPQNPLSTWSGRGRKPQWLIDYLEEGRVLEEFLIKQK